MAFTIPQAELIGASLESVCLGIFLILFPFTFYVLAAQKEDQKGKRIVNKTLLIGGLVLFCLVVAHWIVSQIRLWDAFIEDQNKPGGPMALFGVTRDVRNVLRAIIWSFEGLIIDTLLLYRLYMIWSRDWRVLILPGATYLASIVSGVVSVLGEGKVTRGTNFTLALSDVRWELATYVLSLSTNVLAVGLIGGRILYRNHKMKDTGARSLSRMLLIIIESAGIYCLVNLVTVIALGLNSPVHFAVIGLGSTTSGISFCLIILRVGLAKFLPRFAQSSSIEFSARTPTYRGSIPMHVHIRHEYEQDSSITVGESGAKNKVDGDARPVGPPWPVM